MGVADAGAVEGRLHRGTTQDCLVCVFDSRCPPPLSWPWAIVAL